MKKLLALILSLTAAAAITTGCSAKDGDVDYGNGAGAGTVTNDRTDRPATTRKELSDDIADGINSGLDKTESVVDDVLK
ncbi:MAG: hypothetical protein K6F91_10750 [Ruminococcus sp.]|nr:hypothetical protein [Ruminococcus sp.]